MSTCATYRRVVSGEAEGVGPSVARGLLSALSVPYRLGATLHEIYRAGQGSTDVGLPVVSVGNVTCGGTGKTPLVSMVVKELLARGRVPVVLSRGYAAEADGQNDEARLLEREHHGVLHLQGKDRVALARHAADAQLGDVLVLDDGFQYQALARDLNVCAIDATNPFGHGAVLPRGLLREPLTGLYRARPVVVTRAELVTPAVLDAVRAGVLRWNEHARIVVTEMRYTRLADVRGTTVGAPSELAGRSVVLASGIGNPPAFARAVRLCGARVLHHEARSDHHAWTAAELAPLARVARERVADLVLTTSKDAVKLERLAWPDDAPPLRVLELEAAVRPESEELWKSLLDEALRRT
jgi:tetraacyldisaccharide 4'-kinase